MFNVRKRNRIRLLLLAVVSLTSSFSQASPLIIAVANNFYGPMKSLVADYKTVSSQTIELSTGATGQLYSQIVNGAPFDLFFAADTKRPALLEKDKLAEQTFTYAKGVLVLWSPERDVDLKQDLREGNFEYLAIADPKLAPYGLAAKQSLQQMKLWDNVQTKLVIGKGLNPTYQYVASGNAQLGFVAKSQVFKEGHYNEGSYWEADPSFYEEIKQDATIITSTKNKAACLAFLEYYHSPRAQKIVKSFGYQ